LRTALPATADEGKDADDGRGGDRSSHRRMITKKSGAGFRPPNEACARVISGR
jgi:hypothetical protein